MMYEFYHQDGENTDLPMVGASTKIRDLKPVSGILEQTPNFLRSSDESQIPKLRVVFNRSHPFENQVVSKVASREAREAVYRQVRIETASTSRRAKESQVKPLTIDMLGSIYKLAPFINRAAPFSSLKMEHPFINRAAPFSSILSCSVYKWSCSIFKQLCQTYNNHFMLKFI